MSKRDAHLKDQNKKVVKKERDPLELEKALKVDLKVRMLERRVRDVAASLF